MSNKINKCVTVLHIAHGTNNLNELSCKYFLLLLNKQHNQPFLVNFYSFMPGLFILFIYSVTWVCGSAGSVGQIFTWVVWVTWAKILIFLPESKIFAGV